MSTGPFGAGRLRDTVLGVWAADPARLREDANAEEDHARGYYRDRVVVELAQNAADAAARAGVPGRLHLRLTEHPDGTAVLLAANTGAPLDDAGVASLASLRASAKRDVGGQVGRFGVGFAAVRSVADEVAVLSRTGAVHFSLERTRAALAQVPTVAGEVERRRRELPALRLPFDGPGGVGQRAAVRPGDPVDDDAVDDDAGADPGTPPDADAALRTPLEYTAPGTPLDADAAPGTPDEDPAGRPSWDTVVVLALRDTTATEAVRVQLDQVGDALLLALPALASVSVRTGERTRLLADVGRRWVVARGSGTLDPALLADRPVEERSRTSWQVTWAAPRPGTPPAEPSVHAPTPTDEPCTVPALLIGTFPLDPSRRHVAPGPLTDALVAAAGPVWADLLLACRTATADDRADGRTPDGAPGTAPHPAEGPLPHPLDLVPSGLPAGRLDAALREVVLAVTRDTPVLAPVGGGPPLAPADALVLAGPAGDDPRLLEALGHRLAHLVPAGSGRRAALRLLGVEEVELADVVESLPPLPPAEHRRLLEAVAGAGPAVLEALATLPVPLADGRTVRGVRGLTVLADDVTAVAAADGRPAGDQGASLPTVLGGWGMRVIHPDAAHPLHERLGAEMVDAASLLNHPVVRDQVLAGDDDPDAADLLLGLAATGLADGGAPAPWWGELLLPADDGEPVPARGLVLPGTDAARWFDPEVLPPVDAGVADRWGPVLVALGVRTGLPLVHVPAGADEPAGGDAPAEDVELVLDGLDGWPEYLDALEGLAAGSGPLPVEQHAVADLDAVREECWAEVLRALVDGPARRALAAPGVGPAGPLPSYTAWWLRHRSPLGLERPFALPGAAGGPLAVLLAATPPAVRGLDPELLRALGGVAGAWDLDADGWTRLLDGLPPVGQPVAIATAVAIWQGLAGIARDEDAELAVDRLPALTGGTVDGVRAEVVPAGDVAVATVQWAQLSRTGPHVVVPDSATTALAAALDADLAEERAAGRVTSAGVPAPMPEAVRAAFPAAPPVWLEHEDLRVDGDAVDWWVEGVGRQAVLHAATTAGLARAVARVVGWQHRDTVQRLLVDGGALERVLLELAGVEDVTGADPAG